jgi:glutamate synthase (NADPH/NADH) small chain
LSPVHARERDPQQRINDFNEITLLHTPKEASLEAQRCLHCPEAGCQEACPLHTDIQGALTCLAEGDVAGAAEVYRETNLLPEFCGKLWDGSFSA